MKKVLLRVAQNRLFLYDTSRLIIISSTLLEIVKQEFPADEIRVDKEGDVFVTVMGHEWYLPTHNKIRYNEEEVEKVMIELINNNGKSAFH